MCCGKAAFRKIERRREEYWSKTIAFDCPKTGRRHTINDCFTDCHEISCINGKENGRSVAFMYCLLDPQERYLHNGRAQREP